MVEIAQILNKCQNTPGILAIYWIELLGYFDQNEDHRNEKIAI